MAITMQANSLPPYGMPLPDEIGNKPERQPMGFGPGGPGPGPGGFKYACVGPLVHYFTVHRSGVFVPMLFYAAKRRPARTKDIVLEQ